MKLSILMNSWWAPNTIAFKVEQKEGKKRKKIDLNSFNMSLILAVSRFKVYGVWASEVTLWSNGVEYFIEQLVAIRRIEGGMKDTPFLLLFYKAS